MNLHLFAAAGPSRAGIPSAPRCLAWLVGLMAGLLCAGQAAGDPPRPSVDEVKAAYVYKFAGFVDWPAGAFASPDAPFVVGVAGGGPLQQELEKIVAGRFVQGRALQVRELRDVREAADVHILVIARAAWRRATDWVLATKGHPVLVITDMDQGLERGATLCFVESEGRLRFEASVPSAEQAGLRLSSRLLSVADRVVRAGS